MQGFQQTEIEDMPERSDLVIKKAQRQALKMRRAYDLTAEQAVSWSKWLSASLLGINGAGALGVLSAAEKLHLPQLSGGLFVLGIVWAMLSGWGLQVIYLRQNTVAESAETFWLEVEDAGEVDEEKRSKLKAEESKALKWSWVPPTLGWLSGITFVLAAVVLGWAGVAAK